MSIVSVDNISPIGSGTSVTVNSAATLVLNNVNSTGVVTATSFVGSGANLTSLPSQVTISNNADNRIITGGSGTNLNGESGFTFNGSLASIINSSGPTLELTTNTNAADASLRLHEGTTGSTTNGGGMFYSGADNKLHITCGTNLTTERVTILRDSGYVGINENTPSNQLHVSGTTGTTAGSLLRLDAATGDNFILFDNTSDNTEWAVGYDSGTRSKFDMWYNDNSSGYDLKFQVDGATGAVRKPKNPVFIAYRVSNYNLTTTETELAYDSEKIDIGGNYNPSNGRFTAPVDGLYEFGYASIAKNTNTVYRYTLKVNGNDPYSPLRMELRLHQAASEYATNGEFVVYVNMTAGQHASVYAKSDTNVSNVYGSSNYGYTYFRGRLIG